MSRRSSRRPPFAAPRRGRRGVILLVVLSMLALFTLLVLTFVIYASQHRKTALAVTRADRYDDAYADILTRSAMQLIRGSDNPISVVGIHSLLEDIYGNDSVRGLVSGFRATSADYSYSFYGRDASNGGVITMLYFDTPLAGQDGQPGRAGYDDDGANGNDDLPELGWANTDDLKQVNGFYNGRVLTMLDGPAAGKSTRIVGYVVNPTGSAVGGLAAYYARFVMMPFEGMAADSTVGAAGAWLPQDAPYDGNTFLINGRPFSGSGFGYNPATGFCDAADNYAVGMTSYPRPYALLPFPPSSLPDPSRVYTAEYTDYMTYIAGPDGQLGTRDDRVCANEDYDGADFHNMALAGRIWNNQRRRWDVVLPSFVRPDLISYWVNNWYGSGTPIDMSISNNQREVLKRTFPRPLNLGPLAGLSHPNFSGSNPQLTNYLSSLWTDLNTNGIIDAMDPTSPYGIAWDVDNDGDGRPDSVWMDFGFPVQTAKDGRQYKPLVAPLVLDMDGRLNINAGGSAYHFAASGGSEVYIFQNQFTGPYAGGTGLSTPLTAPVGSGSSPAEINLAAILPAPYLDNNGNVINEYRRLLMGGFPWDYSLGAQNTSRPIVEGKWGESFLYSDGSGRFPLAGITSSSAPVAAGPDGTSGTSDDVYDGDNNFPMAAMGFVTGSSIRSSMRGNFSSDGFFPGTAFGVLGSPSDWDGNGSLILDLSGQPFYNLMGVANTIPGYAGLVGEVFNEPSEIDLSPTAQRYFPGTGGGGTARTIDNPFTPAELEAVLRYFDQDATTLPGRIPQLAPGTVASRKSAGAITTESWDLPCPSVHWTEEQRRYLRDNFGYVPTNLHITDLYALRLLILNAGMTPTQVNANLGILLPPELIAGLKLNLNRPLGNGADDDGDGVVDEPHESIAGSGEPIWGTTAAGGTSALGGPAYLNHSNDGVFANRYLGRQILARQLYCLAMLLVDSGYVDPVQALESLTPTQQYEMTARRIAQWAINVVDYRDRDSIMTPFEYDAYPFLDANGDGFTWDVDNFVGFNPVTGMASADDNDLSVYPHRRLVWGCEYPDVLITETGATHDRNTEDLSSVGGGKYNPAGTGLDPTFDQKHLPVGAAFIELYCTRNPNNTAYLGDLYRNNGYLDLGKMAPASGTGAYPIWRLAVSYGRFTETGANAALAGPKNDVATRASTTGGRPDTTTFQPESFNALGPANVPAGTALSGGSVDNVEIERIVWLTSVPPGGSTVDRDKIYYNYGPGAGAGATDVLLYPGQYAVVGPYRAPSSGPQNVTTFGPSTAAALASEIWLGNTAAASGSGGRTPVTVYNRNAGGVYPTPVSGGTGDIQVPLGIAVAANPAGTANETTNGWDASTPIGFSISEPLPSVASYYPKPTDTGTPTTVAHYEGSTSNVIDGFTTAVDTPFDHSASRPMGQNTNYQDGTKERYKTVFLQRLADPTGPWNPLPGQTGHDGALPVNPYLTIDWMPIDLTVFNGQPLTGTDTDPDATGATIRFGTRQRGNPRTPPAAGGNYNIWKQVDWLTGTTLPPTTGSPISATGNLDHTLGYLNKPFWHTASSPNWITSTNLATVAPGYPNSYIGAPLAPASGGYAVGPTFPWLNWNNRPYTSSMEILSVPASSPGRLLWEYDVKAAADRQYAPKAPGLSTGTPPDVAPFAPYPHLLNMFLSSNSDSSYTPTSATSAKSNLHRVFDYVTVPSRFSGTEDVLNPAAYWETAFGSLPFHPPFNTVSRYRDPGKVNINTVLDDGLIWRAIMNDYPGAYPGGWQQLLWSRRGYGAVPSSANSYPDALQYNVNSPTIFANPFRSYGNNHNVPIPALKNRGALAAATGAERDLVEDGLMRPLSTQTDAVGAANTPTVTPKDPLFATDFTEPFRNTDRSPPFRYQPLQKLDNMLTTRSNVYAIWITVGYFEVTSGTVNAVQPEGVSFGAELGADSGEIKRHRAFFLFDRTIPVGFQRGLDLNVDKAILLRRIIE